MGLPLDTFESHRNYVWIHKILTVRKHSMLAAYPALIPGMDSHGEKTRTAVCICQCQRRIHLDF